MNYIFLDVDGVLNNKKHYNKQHKKYGGRYCCEEMPFNPRSLKNLRRIINKTGAKIVVSSSWRKSNNCMVVLNARLKEYGMEIHSTTMNLYSRGEEITHWCEENLKENDKILIIDDEMYDILEYYNDDKIVKLNGNDGLTFWKTLEAINKLLGE
jgi:hypothetical protein